MTDQEIFEKWANIAVKGIQQSLRTNKRDATGRTIRSVVSNINKSGFTVVGAKHIDNIIGGRGRSRSRSGGGFLQQIKDWVDARSLPKGIAYAIYKSINEKGWSTPPTPNLITSVITDAFIRGLVRDLAKNQLSLMKDVLLKSINK